MIYMDASSVYCAGDLVDYVLNSNSIKVPGNTAYKTQLMLPHVQQHQTDVSAAEVSLLFHRQQRRQDHQAALCSCINI